MTWLSPWNRGLVDDPLRGLWGWFLDTLRPELAELRRACLAAEPGPEADFAYDCYRSHLAVMEWAAREVDRMYLEDRKKVFADPAWEWRGVPTGGHPIEGVDVDAIDGKLARWLGYEGDHTLGVE